ncbi:MAG: helix-turn-helix domain-containing protein [Galbitalea sp.]
MPSKSLIEEPRCQVVRTLDIVGERWSLLIVRNALRGQTRFSEFRDQLGIPTDILTARLATLVEAGVFEKRSYRDPGNRERFSYHLTPAGQALNIVIAALTQWGDEFNPSPWGIASRLVDSESRQKVGLVFVDETGDAVPRDGVAIVPGPASVVTW